MKFVIVVAAGMADEPQEQLGGATPLEAAQTPNLDALAADGRVGQVQTAPADGGPDPGWAMLSVLGYDPRIHFSGTGVLDAAAAGIELAPEEWAFRCDFVSLRERTVVDLTAGRISAAETALLLDSLSKCFDPGQVRFAGGVGRCGTMIVRPVGPFHVSCRPPWEVTRRRIDECMPAGEGGDQLRQVIERSIEAFSDHEINRIRLDLGENPASVVWPWGGGRRHDMPSFDSVFHLGGAAVCEANHVRGLAQSIGWRLVQVQSASGGFAADCAARAAAALAAAEDADVVLVHVEESAEASLMGDVMRKVLCIEDIDARLIAPLRDWVAQSEERRLLVLADAALHAASQCYGKEPVPFLMSRQNVASARPFAFTEKGAQQSGLLVSEGHHLMSYFLRG